jgi:hypothetical protein
MSALTIQATKATGTQGVLVTRSEDDALGSAITALVLDNTLSALRVRELFKDIGKKILEDFKTVSKPVHLAGEGVFEDGAVFDDASGWSDQASTWLGTLNANGSTTITRDGSGEIGSAQMAVILGGGQIKPTLMHHLRGLERELLRLGKEFTSPADYPTSGSRVAE